MTKYKFGWDASPETLEFFKRMEELKAEMRKEEERLFRIQLTFACVAVFFYALARFIPLLMK